MREFCILQGNVLDRVADLPDESVQCCVTSPPYWGLRDYGTGEWDGGDADCDHVVGGQVQDNEAKGAIVAGVRPGVDARVCRKCGAVRVDQQLGLERTPEEYTARMVEVFREVKRVLKPDGVLFLNLGDSYASQGGAHGGRDDNQLNVGARAVHEAGNGDQHHRKPAPGLKPKDLVGIPWRVAFALQADGWWLRSEIIWHKPNPMPESVRDRPTKAHEQIFLLTKAAKYYWDADAVREPATASHPPGNKSHKGATEYEAGDEFHLTKAGLVAYAKRQRKAVPLEGSHGTMGHDGNGMRMPEKWNNPKGRNVRSVWTISYRPYPESHFATFPPEIPERCIKSGSREGDIVLDPFAGAGTTGLVALRLNRGFVGIELNPEYCEMARERIVQDAPLLNQEAPRAAGKVVVMKARTA